MDPHSRSLRLQILIDRYKVTQLKLILALTNELERSVKGVLLDSSLNELNRISLRRELTIADQHSQRNGAKLMATYSDAVRDFASAMAEVEAVAWGVDAIGIIQINGAAFDTPLGVDGSDRGRTVEAFLLSWWNDARQSVFGMLMRGAHEGRNNIQLLADVRGNKKMSFKDGLMSRIMRSAQTTNSTIVQHVAMAVREAVVKGTDYTVILWSALFEKHTCSRCGAFDGNTYGVGEGARSPIHHGCRCMMVPLREDEKTDFTFTYFAWLKTQDRKFVETALGDTRAALLLDSGLTAERFGILLFDKKFEQISLVDLRKIAPSIFARAGV